MIHKIAQKQNGDRVGPEVTFMSPLDQYGTQYKNVTSSYIYFIILLHIFTSIHLVCKDNTK